MDSGGTCITAHRNTIHASFHSAPKGRPAAARVCLRSFWAAGLEHLIKSLPPPPPPPPPRGFVSVSHTHTNFHSRVSLSVCLSFTDLHKHTHARTRARAHTHTYTCNTNTPHTHLIPKRKRTTVYSKSWKNTQLLHIYNFYDKQSSEAGH